MNPAIRVRNAGDDDRDWIDSAAGPIGGACLAVGGVLYVLRDLPALVAETAGDRAGFAAWSATGPDAAELVAIRAINPWRGTGTALLAALEARLAADGVGALTVRTTNDNIEALGFYQHRGFVLTTQRPGAFDEVRRLKNLPTGLTSRHGTPLHDELVLTRRLERRT